MKKTYAVELDVTLGCYREVKADSREDAIEQVEKLAYKDSWCTGMPWGGAKVYSIEQVEEE